MEDFKKNTKINCYREGGQVTYKSRKAGKEDMSSDVTQDKALVKKGVKQHEAALHEGEPKTELKLKTGGRVKKSSGTVKKFEQKIPAVTKEAAGPEYKATAGLVGTTPDVNDPTQKMKCGGGVYGAKKTAKDIKSIDKAKDCKPKMIACGGKVK